jgi:hypothetical protein
MWVQKGSNDFKYSSTQRDPIYLLFNGVGGFLYFKRKN